MKILGMSPLAFASSLITLSIVGHILKNKGSKVLPNPRKGGWSHKKIAEYNRATGSKLKHGVNYDPITLEDFKRKGSWATRHYKRKSGWNGLNMAPLINNKGELLPFSTQAIVWGEKPPKDRKAQKRLVKLGERLLATYQKYKKMGYRKGDVLPLNIRKKFKRGLRK